MILTTVDDEAPVHFLSSAVVCAYWTVVKATWTDARGWTRIIEGTAVVVSEKVNQMEEEEQVVQSSKRPPGLGALVSIKGAVTLEVNDVMIHDPERWSKLDTLDRRVDNVVVLWACYGSYRAVSVR